MVQLGHKTSLRIVKKTDFGYFLDGGERGEILMPNRYVTPEMVIDDYVDVFVFLDGEERIVATTETPYAQEGEFGWMKVNKIETVGAFLDWGVSKELLVPFSEQKIKMEEGRYYLVYVYLDKLTDRLAATMKVEKFLDKSPSDYKVNDQVDLIIWTATEVGYKAIINGKHQGVIYRNEIFKPIHTGQKMVGYIKKVREDGKIDLALDPLGYVKIDAQAQKVLDLLHKSKGKLPYNDKTDPEVIYKIFGMSKKVFKQAIGTLYKQKQITITDQGIAIVVE
ncbi:MAG: GntR family transcriptional regulator [Saprospiraceae bacterium]|nr:GntR family transcriptional regulator [Saprospiraceae bacterium]